MIFPLVFFVLFIAIFQDFGHDKKKHSELDRSKVWYRFLCSPLHFKAIKNGNEMKGKFFQLYSLN